MPRHDKLSNKGGFKDWVVDLIIGKEIRRNGRAHNIDDADAHTRAQEKC